MQMDRILLAYRAADSAAVAASRINMGPFLRCAITDSAKLTDSHTLPASITRIGLRLGNVLGPEHCRRIVGHGHLHGQAIRSIAIAYATDKWRHERPDAVAEALFFMFSEACQSLLFADNFRAFGVRRAEKARA